MRLSISKCSLAIYTTAFGPNHVFPPFGSLFEYLKTVIDLVDLLSEQIPLVVEQVDSDLVQGADSALQGHKWILHNSLMTSVESQELK